MSRAIRRALSSALALALSVPVGLGLVPGTAAPAEAAGPPVGFTEQIVLSGLHLPTKVVFAPDGRVFVAQKDGVIKVFDSLSDTTATVVADLRTNVYNYEDLGMIGMAVPPSFPADPYLYVSYTYDGLIGGTAPTYNDTCHERSSCAASSRVSRLRLAGDVMTGPEEVLLHDWCQQIESHSIGELRFGPDGALYVTGGDGASGTFVDYGQAGNPTNPCGDPPSPVGGAMTPPTAEGGALRAQDLRTGGDPTGLSGTLIRVDPETAAAMPDNPMAASADANTRRIVAYGLRNPYRWAFRPGTDEVWVADVGWRNWEEINRIVDPADGPVRNYGWPCYEGNSVQSGYRAAQLDLCRSLYAAPAGTATGPHYTYHHNDVVAPGDGCRTGGSAPTGITFYPTEGGNYPAPYAGALFFADYSRGCIWAMRAGPDGVPDPSDIMPFTSTASGPVDLVIGPDNNLYYADLTGGTVRRFHYSSGNLPPQAAFTANPTSGNAPLTVSFDASNTTDPDAGDILTYQWDFTDDGTFDASGPTATHTYTTTGTHTARLRVSDMAGAVDTETLQIFVGTDAPVPVIDSPTAALRWEVGETVSFSGHATDPQDGTLPASSLSWQLINRHCYSADDCHTHHVQSADGVASGTFVAPDHEYPSHLELTLTATDSSGLTSSTTTRLDPKTVNLTFASSPGGLELNHNGAPVSTPAVREVIVGSTNTISAPTPQTAGSSTFTFEGWSDGGAQTHVITAPAIATTYTATYSGSGSCADTFGYTCDTVPGRPIVPADDTVLPLSGDEAITRVDLPFAFPFYGQSYDAAWIDVNGKLSFLDPNGSWGVNTPIPDVSAPNAAIYPFWDDLWARDNSTIRTAVTGTAPNRRFNVEWRNIGLYGSTSGRLTFQVLMEESGRITFNYADLGGARELGNSATVGIENAAGTIALQYSINEAVLANNTAIVITPPGGGGPTDPPPVTGTVSGVVTSNGTPVVGATVTLNPGNLSATTAAGGSYTLGSVPAGTYTVTGTGPGGLTGSGSVTVTAGGTHTTNLTLTGPTNPTPTPTPPPTTPPATTPPATTPPPTTPPATTPPATTPPPAGGVSYTKSTESRPYTPISGGTPIPLTGDDSVEQIELPFAFPFYGHSYTTAWVSANGFLSFEDPGNGQPINGPIPDASAPNAALYPYWDDLVVRADTVVRSAVTGSGDGRRFVLEWYNHGQYGSSSARVTIQVSLSVSGEIVFNYESLAPSKPRERGDSATVGIENHAGTQAVQHSFNEAALADNTAIVFTPSGGGQGPTNQPPVDPTPATTGTVSGVVTSGGTPVAGAAVTLTPGGRTATTTATGSYTIGSVPAGTYTVAATADGGRSASGTVTVAAAGAHTANLALTAPTTAPPPTSQPPSPTPPPASGGGAYTKSTESRPYTPISGGTPIPLTGDDSVEQIELPFAFPFYGQTYTTAWVSSNGFLSFEDPGGAQPINGPIPDTTAPNTGVYPYWDDLVVRADTVVRSAVTGSGDGRRFVLEWYNHGQYGSSSARVTIQVSLSVSGEIVFNYESLASSKPRERGDSATVGIENHAGTQAVQHSFNEAVLADNTAIIFTPQ
ncbi:PQQ-dependent sugar dehydrogenase, partial [Polymorphospora rubra]